jgi:hypothetical protein
MDLGYLARPLRASDRAARGQGLRQTLSRGRVLPGVRQPRRRPQVKKRVSPDAPSRCQTDACPMRATRPTPRPLPRGSRWPGPRQPRETAPRSRTHPAAATGKFAGTRCDQNPRTRGTSTRIGMMCSTPVDPSVARPIGSGRFVTTAARAHRGLHRPPHATCRRTRSTQASRPCRLRRPGERQCPSRERDASDRDRVRRRGGGNGPIRRVTNQLVSAQRANSARTPSNRTGRRSVNRSSAARAACSIAADSAVGVARAWPWVWVVKGA